MRYVDVILPLPLEGYFTYGVPDRLADAVRPGMRLSVPFGRSKTYTAMAVRLHDEKPDFDVKDIRGVLDASPVLPDRQLRLWQWIAEYYMCPVGDVFKAAMPSGLKTEEGYRPRTEKCVALVDKYRTADALHIVMDTFGRAAKQREVFLTYLRLSHWDTLRGTATAEPVAEVTCEELINESHCTAAVFRSLVSRQLLRTYDREIGRLDITGEAHPDQVKPLSEAQQKAYDQILTLFPQRKVVLLHGVTSSGKTEIYIHLIDKVLAEGRQVLYLLPEIALTVQMMQRLKRVFGPRLGIYHSKYSDAERVEIWRKQLSDRPYDVILGARSAVFLPFQRLGLVIVDEEHETSYKQQDPAPRYHARSAAIMLARMYGADTLLGTATPSMETYANARSGKYGLVTLTMRYRDVSLPEVRVVDTKDLQRRRMMTGPFSPDLLAAMRAAFDEGRQVILFQNRRGFAPMIECRVCGWVPRCHDCDVSLTLHKSMNVLTCHYCGHAYEVPAQCPSCESTDLRGRGYGTEKIEDHLRALFPEVRIARMDLDTTRTRNAYDRLIGDFSEGRTQVLIGTQMVTKGLDFGGVSVVGILSADSMLNYPDFRAYEYAFTMMSQVAGRAGRRGRRGLVILQTKNPDLPVISQVVRHDFGTFFRDVAEERRLFRYPPFFHLVYVYLRHRDESVVEHAAADLSVRLRQFLGDRVLGPDKPSVARVKSESIRKLVIKLEQGIDLPRVRSGLRQIQSALLHDRRYGAVTMYYDVDPM